MAYSQTHLVLLVVMLAVACSSDVGLRKIPNSMSIAIALTGLLARWAGEGARGVGSGLVAGIAVGALLAPFWAKRIIGGGDLKLALAAGVWVGLGRSPRYLLASGLAGGVVAIACYASSGREARRAVLANVLRLHAPTWERALESSGRTVLVPYGVAFAVGALFALHS